MAFEHASGPAIVTTWLVPPPGTKEKAEDRLTQDYSMKYLVRYLTCGIALQYY